MQRALIFTNNSRRNSLSKVVSSALGSVGNKQRYDATWCSVFELQNKEYSDQNILFLIFFFNGYIRNIGKFSGQGLNLNRNSNLKQNCGNNGSLHPLHRARDGTHDPNCCSQLLNPLCQSGNSQHTSFLKHSFIGCLKSFA